jgi:class 3 adenylate cyclase
MAIRVLELHHHAVRVGPTSAEADVVRDFYVDVLGLGVDAGRRVGRGAPGYWLDVGDSAQVHLMGVTGRWDAEPIDPSAPHVALAVADVTAAAAELARRGIPHRVLNGPAGPDSAQVFLHDPAGNVVELHQAGSCRCVARTRAAAGAGATAGGGAGAGAAPAAAAPGYARVQGAVMFADMRGFTGIAERLSPDAVVPLLNEYFTVLTDITDDHRGTVFHMAGDGLMAGFGVPAAGDAADAHDDASERAVAAARQMLARFGEIARRWKRVLDIDTGVGIGINAGEVIAGNVGSAAHRSYTLIGDTVNVASRLSQRARAGEALFSRVVKSSLEARGRLDVPALALPRLLLRGRATPVEIWCIPADERVDFRPLTGAEPALA